MRIASLFFLLFTLSWGCTSPTPEPQEKLYDDGTSKYRKAGQKVFYHGVASGDPLPDRVILWTRTTPEYLSDVEVGWKVATDKNMQQAVESGTYTTNADRDFTVKVDVDGLDADQHYYYQFTALDASSPIGRTKTAPGGQTADVNFAVVSCTNFEAGYFNGLARIAENDELDAVIHLGDYFYEYEPGRYGDTTLGRLHLPPKEIITLQDYRTRYAQYRMEEDFQAAHQMHPFIVIWDDHEISNNAYQSGAQNHQPEAEGDYDSRKAIARKVYFEWMPIRENPGQRLYRHFDYGDLVDLIMLDERLEGRTAPVDSLTQPDYESDERSMLGAAQLEWFQNQLANSDAIWKIVGNQVIFSDLDFSVLRPDRGRNLDAWDGYPAEKRKILRFLKENKAENVIFLAGDTHSSWAFEIPESIEHYKATRAAVALELGTPSISSANQDENTGADTVLMAEKTLMRPQNNPQLKYVNMRDHGYLLLFITPEEVRAEWRYVEEVKRRTKGEKTGKVLRIKRGMNVLIPET